MIGVQTAHAPRLHSSDGPPKRSPRGTPSPQGTWGYLPRDTPVLPVLTGYPGLAWVTLGGGRGGGNDHSKQRDEDGSEAGSGDGEDDEDEGCEQQ